MGSKDIIESVHKWLVAIGLGGIIPKIYLSAFMIHHWGDEVTGVKPDENTPISPSKRVNVDSSEEAAAWDVRWKAGLLVRSHCVMVSKSVVKLGDALQHVRIYRNYGTSFNAWKTMDLTSITNHMCYNYNELNNCQEMIEASGSKNVENQVILDQLVHKVDKVLKVLKVLKAMKELMDQKEIKEMWVEDLIYLKFIIHLMI